MEEPRLNTGFGVRPALRKPWMRNEASQGFESMALNRAVEAGRIMASRPRDAQPHEVLSQENDRAADTQLHI